MIRSIFLGPIMVLCFGCGSMTAKGSGDLTPNGDINLTRPIKNHGYFCDQYSPRSFTDSHQIRKNSVVGYVRDKSSRVLRHIISKGTEQQHYFCTMDSEDDVVVTCCHAQPNATADERLNPAKKTPAEDVAEIGLELRPRAEPPVADAPHGRVDHDGYTCEGYMTAKFEIGDRMSLLNHFTDHDKLFAHMESDGRHYFCRATQVPKTTQIETSFLNCCLTERLR